MKEQVKAVNAAHEALNAANAAYSSEQSKCNLDAVNAAHQEMRTAANSLVECLNCKTNEAK